MESNDIFLGVIVALVVLGLWAWIIYEIIASASRGKKIYNELELQTSLLMEMNLQNYNPEWYIFSTHNRHRSFLPGPKPMHPNTTNNNWRKIVKSEKTGLGIDVNQYSLKKLAGNDMVRIQINNNADKLLKLPQSQMGHSHEKQTTDYVREHLEVMKELVKTQMPVL